MDSVSADICESLFIDADEFTELFRAEVPFPERHAAEAQRQIRHQEELEPHLTPPKQLNNKIVWLSAPAPMCLRLFRSSTENSELAFQWRARSLSHVHSYARIPSVLTLMLRHCLSKTSSLTAARVETIPRATSLIQDTSLIQATSLVQINPGQHFSVIPPLSRQTRMQAELEAQAKERRDARQARSESQPERLAELRRRDAALLELGAQSPPADPTAHLEAFKSQLRRISICSSWKCDILLKYSH